MQCQCGRQVKVGYKFCPNCGQSLTRQSNSIENSGGINLGNQYQAGRDINISTPAPSNDITAEYDAIPKWRSPFTQSILTWIGTSAGILSLFPIWKTVSPAINLLQLQFGTISEEASLSKSPSTQIFSVAALFLLLFAVIISFRLRNIAKKQIRKPALPGWAINGRNNRITIEQIKPGKCPRCGGKMKYYNKPIQWDSSVDINGKTKRTITKRAPALECLRNSNHFYLDDPAEKLD